MAFAACLTLCAAVWAQNKPAVETPVLPTPSAVIDAQPKVPEVSEIEEIIMPEVEKVDAAEPEQAEEIAPAPESTQPPTPLKKEISVASMQEPELAPSSPNSALGDMVYVSGFGWLESQGPNHCDYTEDMYENGNKIGRMN